jgi:hypothetical protein
MVRSNKGSQTYVTPLFFSVRRSASDLGNDNEFDADDYDADDRLQKRRDTSVGTHWRDFFHVEEYD